MAKKYTLFLAAVVSFTAALILLALRPWESGLRSLGPFSELPVTFNDYDLFDLGVARIDDDAYLDIFTVNHSARQTVATGDGTGRFTNRLSEFHLDQDYRHAGVEDTESEPGRTRPGVYVYRQRRQLHIAAHDLGSDVSGTVEVAWPLVVATGNGATATVEERPAGPDGVFSTVRFTIPGGSSVSLNGRNDIVELPHLFSFETMPPGTEIFLGSEAVPAEADRFTLMWRDRHSMAWADYDGDNALDVFVGRGGVKASLDKVPVPIEDELFVFDGGAFENRIDRTGIRKGNCPARQAAWVDYDADGDLDLYVSCGRETNQRDFPDRLFRRAADDSFSDVAAEVGLDEGAISVFAWLDSDGDGDMDLLSAAGESITHYVNEGARFRAVGVGDRNDTNVVKFAVSDYDADGDFDAYAVSRTEGRLLVNESGVFEVAGASATGLPNGGRTANWTDFDNDGLVDIHVVPSGLFRQRPDHRFERTTYLEEKVPANRVSEARCSWFDFDNNGTRDALCAVNRYPVRAVRIARKLFDRSIDTREWSTVIYRNDSTQNHWLQVELMGTARNRQAVGARVAVTTGEGRQSQMVGSSEGSHFSQGHYRLYFGLGPETLAESVRVDWPDGRTTELDEVPADQLLVIRAD
jgi:hypothetical protein